MEQYCIDSAYNKFNPPVLSSSYSDISLDETEIKVSNGAKKYVLQMTMEPRTSSIQVNYTWISKSIKQKPLTINILNLLYKQFPKQCTMNKMLCITEITKDEIQYWVDYSYRNETAWHDNILVSWKQKSSATNAVLESQDSKKNILIPSKLQLFFKFEDKENIYCMIHTSHKRTKQVLVLSSM